MSGIKTFIKEHASGFWLAGAIQALPIMLGYLPVGFAYGILAQKAQISVFNTLLMSIIVFAGSSQLIAVGLISAGVAPVSVILTTFVVNLRHMLMSAALSPFLHRWRKRALAGFAFQLTDETFALHSTRLPDSVSQSKSIRGETFAINILSQSAWVLGTWLGILGGKMVADIEPLALDYALPAMFIALLVMHIKTKPQIAVAVLAGFFSVGLYLGGLTQWHVIIATIIGAFFGVWMESWTKK